MVADAQAMSGRSVMLTKPEEGDLTENERRDRSEQERFGLRRCWYRAQPTWTTAVFVHEHSRFAMGSGMQQCEPPFGASSKEDTNKVTGP